MEKEKVLIQNPDVVFRQEGKDSFLFHSESGRLICVNKVGTMIWKLCKGKNRKKDIINSLMAKYKDTPQEEIGKDAEEFISKLITAGYLGVEI